MQDAYTILNVDKAKWTDFSLQALRVDNLDIERVINKSVHALKLIEQQVCADENIKVSQVLIDDVLYKVVETSHMEEPDMDSWSIHELRIISYYIIKLQNNDNIFNFALNVLDSKWRDMYINGLVFSVMNSWFNIKPDLRKNLCNLIVKKISQYEGQNSRYLNIKNHANFFDDNGPIRMAALVLQKGLDIKDAPTLLGNKPKTIYQSFYSDVIIKYFVSVTFNINSIKEVFELHDNNRTKKLLFCHLVECAEKESNIEKQILVSRLINDTLGDITIASTWAPFPGATHEEAQRLKKAMQLVNLWLTRRVIESFFEVCVQDRERKKFWIRFVNYVNGFRIVGSTLTKRIMQNDPRLSSLFQNFFIETNSKNSQTSALVLCMKDRVLVEFSDVGALYVYKQDNQQIKFLKEGKKYLPSINDLKQPSLNYLIKEEWGELYYYHEGRLMHIGYWQIRLYGWLQQMVFSEKNTGISFFATKDDNIFTAKPLPKEEEIKKTSRYSAHQNKTAVTNNKIQRGSSPKPIEDSTTKSVNDTNKGLCSNQQSSVIPKARPVVYLTNVFFNIYSKWFFDDLCRIVCNTNGYYINTGRGLRFVLLRNFDSNVKSSGNIWIKKPDKNNWIQMVHVYKKQEYIIGYIKRGGGGFMYKQDLRQTDYMFIK